MRPLGKRQLERLIGLSNPMHMQVVGDVLTDTLEKRGLCKAHSPSGRGFIRITPAGVRAVADAYDAGLVDQFAGEQFRKILDRSKRGGLR